MHTAPPRRLSPSTAARVLGLWMCTFSPLGLSAAVQVEQWDTHEITLSGPSGVGNPFVEVALSCTFTHATSQTRLAVDGFYNGGNTWRFRFMPTQLGIWHWTTASNDPGLGGKTGTIECVMPRKPYLHGPLKVQG